MTAKKGKKTLTIVASVFLFVIVVMAITPFVFKGKIMEVAKNELNKQLNAKVDFETLKISLFRNFPNASVSVRELQVVGTGDFSQDTLVNGKEINLVIDLKSLFSDTGYEIKNVEINNARMFAHVLKDGRANWDIVKTDSTAKEDTTPSKFSLKLKNFIIKNADIRYMDEQGETALQIQGMNHRLSGDLTADSTLLSTRTTIDSLDFWNGKIKYTDKLNIQLDVDLKADFNKNIYTLANNAVKINEIPFSVNGWVQMLDNGMDMDLKLNTDQVDFKSILSLIPSFYAKSFEDIKTGGNVALDGFVKGKMVDETYPAFDFNLDIKEAWFQYPSLPKSVQKINIASRIASPGGDLDATVVDVPAFSFDMGGNPFFGSLHVAHPVSDPDFAMKAVGKLNLGMIKEVYPLEKGTELNGMLDMDVNTAGKMSYIDTNQYDKFTFGGTVNVKDMIVQLPEMKQDISISNANLLFNNRYLNLTNLLMKIGQNDLSANGKVENYMGYALKDKTLIGDFTFNSNYLNLNDFMSSDTEEEADTSSLQVVELPKNLHLALNGNFKKLVFNKMDFANAVGSLLLADGDLKINNLSTDGFGGRMSFTGTYSTSNPAKPAINMNLELADISFAQIFSQVETLQKFAPIFGEAMGTFSSKLQLTTLLQNNMMPVLSSVLGSGSLTTKSVTVKNVAALSELASSLKYDKLTNMALQDISLMFDIEDGKVNTKPFNVNIGDLQMSLGGSTGLDQSIAYAGTAKLPEILSLGGVQSIGFTIGGTFTKPKVQLDLANMIKNIVGDKTADLLGKATDAKNNIAGQAAAKREQALKEAQEKADRLLANAKSAGDKLVEQAQVSADSLVAKASNPIAKAAVKKGADELIIEARKKADKLNSDAQIEADKLIQQASEKTELK